MCAAHILRPTMNLGRSTPDRIGRDVNGDTHANADTHSYANVDTFTHCETYTRSAASP